MSLASGEYLTKTTRTVVVWPPAGPNGDGPEVWENQFDHEGRMVGRIRSRDKHGAEVFDYLPPEGFQNRPGYDHTDNYVKLDSRGNVYRQPNGEAVCIKPGQAIVFEPDGSTTLLEDEYAQYMFNLAHDASGAVSESGSTKADTVTEEDPRDARIRELEAKLAGEVTA